MGDKYDYSKVNYVNNHTKIIIICKEHGEFKQQPNAHIDQQQGCYKCGIVVVRNIKKLTTKQFIEKAKLIHGDKYDYSKVNYVNNHTKIIIICKEHGEYEQIPNSHLNKKGCSKCSNCYKPNTNEWIQKAKLIHGDKYDYSKVDYVNNSTKIKIICKEHGEFKQQPSAHIDQQQGCYKCSNNQYSKMSIDRLNFISKKDNITIQHALNHGEYKIPNTRLKADGYCKETNTIYEFHGDYWHGNPFMYNANEDTYFGKTFGELYEKTLKKELIIKDKGFNLYMGK